MAELSERQVEAMEYAASEVAHLWAGLGMGYRFSVDQVAMTRLLRAAFHAGSCGEMLRTAKTIADMGALAASLPRVDTVQR